MRTLILSELFTGMPALTSATGMRLAEAASLCLESEGHAESVDFVVNGDHVETFRLERMAIDEVIRRTFDDSEEATEEGACAVSILLAREITGWSVVRRARRGTGFDYYLGEESLLDFRARLEVSGIRRGTPAQIETRLRQKRAQIRRSDADWSGLAAYAIVVEFHSPEAKVSRR